MDNEIIINLGQTTIKGFSVDDSGGVHDFNGTLKRRYSSLNRASQAARRKYGDPSITVTEIETTVNKYKVNLSELMKIATKIEE